MTIRRRRALELSPIKAMELAAARIPGSVSLAQGIPSFDTPEVIKEYVKEKLDRGETARYSLAPGLIELRELIAESLLHLGMRYDPDGEILVTAGSIEAIVATLIALVEPGQEVIIPSPSYASYQQAIRTAGGVPVFAPLDEERNFDLDVAAIARRITPRTAAIFYCNPNNPTGTIYSRAQSQGMMELAERHDLMIITDEVYKDFRYTEAPYFTPAQDDAFRERVVRIFSFSKAYAMTGWRVGYLHTHRRVAAEILKVHDALVTCAPVISQHAAVAALAYGEASIEEFRRAYRRRRDLMLGYLDEMTHVFDYQIPNGAYFVFPRIKDAVPLSGDSRALAARLLERAGVALVPGIAFGPTGESHLRMSFGREEAEIDAAFQRLRQYFGRDGGGGAPAAVKAPGFTPPAADPDRAEFETAQPAGRARREAGLRGAMRRGAVRYLNALARWYLFRRRPGVIAIAGNQGKTVLKRTLHRMLGQNFRVRANPRSYNTEIGLPLAVLGLEIDPRSWKAIARTLAAATLRAGFGRETLDWLILELGSRHPGDMAALLGTVRPDWAVVTNLVTGEGGEPEQTALLQSEAEALCDAVPPERMLMSRDDPVLQRIVAKRGIRPIPIELSALRARAGGFAVRGASQDYDLGPEVVGKSAAYALLSAIALGERLGIPPGRIREFLAAETAPAPKRDHTGSPEGVTNHTDGSAVLPHTIRS